jgi:hypothetical protein
MIEIAGTIIVLVAVWYVFALVVSLAMLAYAWLTGYFAPLNFEPRQRNHYPIEVKIIPHPNRGPHHFFGVREASIGIAKKQAVTRNFQLRNQHRFLEMRQVGIRPRSAPELRTEKALFGERARAG